MLLWTVHSVIKLLKWLRGPPAGVGAGVGMSSGDGGSVKGIQRSVQPKSPLIHQTVPSATTASATLLRPRTTITRQQPTRCGRVRVWTESVLWSRLIMRLWNGEAYGLCGTGNQSPNNQPIVNNNKKKMHDGRVIPCDHRVRQGNSIHQGGPVRQEWITITEMTRKQAASYRNSSVNWNDQRARVKRQAWNYRYDNEKQETGLSGKQVTSLRKWQIRKSRVAEVTKHKNEKWRVNKWKMKEETAMTCDRNSKLCKLQARKRRGSDVKTVTRETSNCRNGKA